MVRRLKRVNGSMSIGSGEVAFEDFVAEPAKTNGSRKPKPLAKGDFQRLLFTTIEMKDRKQWREFDPKNFVALYCLLHHHVYGVVPEEVRDSFTNVVAMARRMLANEFDGDKNRMIDFVRWVWSREAKRLRHRDPENDFRIGWRLQFGRQLLSDYRVARARKGRKVQ